MSEQLSDIVTQTAHTVSSYVGNTGSIDTDMLIPLAKSLPSRGIGAFNMVLYKNPIIFFLITFILTVSVYYGLSKFIAKLFGTKNHKGAPVQILNYVVFDKFRPEWLVTSKDLNKMLVERYNMSQESADYQVAMTKQAGIGDSTYLPPSLLSNPPDFSMAAARYEAEIILFNCIDRILLNTGVKAKDIDVLVVNCSLFNPTPSLCAMIINKYNLRGDIITFNVSGMGCAASPHAIRLASDALRSKTNPHPVALVVSTEILTHHVYRGNEKAFLTSNSLFRMNGAAMMLSLDTQPVLGRVGPTYTIENLEHVHLAADNEAYKCVYMVDDKEGKVGMRTDNKVFMKHALKAITINLKRTAPLLVPLKQRIFDAIYQFMGMKRDIASAAQQTIKGMSTSTANAVNTANGTSANGTGSGSSSKPSQGGAGVPTPGTTTTMTSTLSSSSAIANVSPSDDNTEVDYNNRYDNQISIPDNRSCFSQNVIKIVVDNQSEVGDVPNLNGLIDYWCIQASSRQMLEVLQLALDVPAKQIRASHDVLYQYGNTSSASIWYVLSEIEKHKTIAKDQRVLAISYGSGVKSAVVVLRKL